MSELGEDAASLGLRVPQTEDRCGIRHISGSGSPLGRRGIWVEADLGKWCPEGKRECEMGQGLR